MKIDENQRRRRKGEEEEEEVRQFYISQLPIDRLCGCYWYIIYNTRDEAWLRRCKHIVADRVMQARRQAYR